MTEPTKAEKAPRPTVASLSAEIKAEREAREKAEKALAEVMTAVADARPADPEMLPTGAAWSRVMRGVGAIEKGERNKDLGFRFRGIDAAMNAVGPVLREHGAAVLPVGVEILESERYSTTTKGTLMHGMVTRHDWLLIGPDGEPMYYRDGRPIVMQTLGQAADSGDKAATKAASVAYRTLLLQSLTVPTGEPDPDEHSHDRAVPDARQEQWDRITGLAKYARQSQEAIRKHYAEKMGHEIDGPDATVATLTEYGDRLEASFREQAEKANTAETHPDPPADSQDPPAAAPSDPPATEQAPADPPAQPEPQTPPQGRDPRQALWDDILESGRKARMTAEAIRAHFREWSRDANPDGPVEIDGPRETTTSDLLTRYVHVLRALATEAGP